MEKTNIRRLIGVMMPFVIMVILQRLGYLLLDMTSLSGVLRDLLAFVIASAGGIFFFRMSCGKDVLRLTADPVPETDEDDERAVPPFPQRDTLPGQVMYILVCVGALIVTMHIVAMVVKETPADRLDTQSLAAEFVSLVFLHPILEEYIFRWLYYRELRPMHPIFAGLAQAVMFAIVHGSVGGMIYALFAGVVLVFVMEHAGSLAVSAVAHMIVNLRSFAFMTVLADHAHLRTVIDFCVVSVGFGAFLALMVRRGLREIWKNTETEEQEEGDGHDGDDAGTAGDD